MRRFDRDIRVRRWRRGQDDGPAVEALLGRYYARMRRLDPAFRWGDPDWWKDGERAVVLVASEGGAPRGFLIIGRGSFADPDVACEICEVASESGPHLLAALVRAAPPFLEEPWGFQVLAENRRAGRLFERLLERRGLSYSRDDAIDGGARVVRYRVGLRRTGP